MPLKRIILEMGTGNDLHGGDYTKAALRAIDDATHHSSLSVIRSLGLSYVPLLLLLYGAGIVCIGAYRIDRASHAENLRRLAAQAEPPPTALTGSDS